MTTAMATSRQPRPQPHASGTAASSARNGTAMNTPRATFSHPALVSASRTGSGPAGRAGAATAVAAALGGGVMGILRVGEASYATVTYGIVGLSILRVDVHRLCAGAYAGCQTGEHTDTPDRPVHAAPPEVEDSRRPVRPGVTAAHRPLEP